MKSEQFVKNYYSDARAINSPSNFGEGNRHKYTIIKATNSIGMLITLSDGKSESNAWVKAKKSITDSLKRILKPKICI